MLPHLLQQGRLQQFPGDRLESPGHPAGGTWLGQEGMSSAGARGSFKVILSPGKGYSGLNVSTGRVGQRVCVQLWGCRAGLGVGIWRGRRGGAPSLGRALAFIFQCPALCLARGGGARVGSGEEGSTHGAGSCSPARQPRALRRQWHNVGIRCSREGLFLQELTREQGQGSRSSEARWGCDLQSPAAGSVP